MSDSAKTLDREFGCGNCGLAIPAGTPLNRGGIHYDKEKRRWKHDSCPDKPAATAAGEPAPAAASQAGERAVVPAAASAIEPIFGFTPDQVQLIKDMTAPKAELTDRELGIFLYTARRLGLDPVARQIYAVKYTNNKTGAKEMSLQTGIDGYRAIAARSGASDGIDAPVFGPLIEADGGHYPEWASVTVYRKGAAHGFTAVVRWFERRRLNRDGTLSEFWVKQPYNQLGKCAEAAAWRMACPADLSGLYTDDEMGQAENPSRRLPPPPPPGAEHATDADYKVVEPAPASAHAGAVSVPAETPASKEEEDPRLEELKVSMPYFISRLADKAQREACRARLKEWLVSRGYVFLAEAQIADVPELEALLASFAEAPARPDSDGQCT